MPPTVQVLYFEGCPGGAASREALREALPEVKIDMVELPPREFRKLGIPGSPTLLLNGRDLFPAPPSDNRSIEIDTGPSRCRLYGTPEGLKSHPTANMIRQAFEESATGTAAASEPGDTG
ncbi:MAG TPA: hypothetical protein VFJ72_15320 [Rubrobacteraceae bacterium]|nr:hypothetical protein [Rubrobacteraceae bacterium]